MTAPFYARFWARHFAGWATTQLAVLTHEARRVRFDPGRWDLAPIVAAVDDESAPDPLTQPLPVAAPGSWRAREDRVRWVLAHFTEGEKAKLYLLLYQDGLRLDSATHRWKAERAQTDRHEVR